MSWFGILVVFGSFVVMTLLLQLVKVPKHILLMAEVDDEDMKIAGSSFSKEKKHGEDTAEQAAEEFLREKELGNIEKADKIGNLFANKLWQIAQELIMDEENYSKEQSHNLLVMYSYVINKVISEESPNSLLAQTALSVFYERVDKISTILSSHIEDTGAYTLYVLNDRKDDDQSIGEIYAGLCGNKEDKELIKRGEVAYKECYKVTKEIFVENADYSKEY